jgi:hypothetical protein
MAIATSLLAFSSFLAIDFFQKYEKHQLLHLVNRVSPFNSISKEDLVQISNRIHYGGSLLTHSPIATIE